MWTRRKIKKYNRSPALEGAQAIRKFVVSFCSSSTIHGIRYFTEERLHWSERCLWLLAISASVWLCNSFVRNIWMQWHSHPVNLLYIENETPISAIPLPTVTICSSVKVKQSVIDLPELYKSKRLKAAALNDTRLHALAHVCDNFPHTLEFHDNFTDESIYETLASLAPTFEETFQNGKLDGNEINLSDYFTPVFTRKGYCFTFNSLNSNEIYTKEMVPAMQIVKNKPNGSKWSLENGYIDGAKEKYPFRVFHPKETGGLFLSLEVAKSDLEYVCRTAGLNFHISLTVPGGAFASQTFKAPIYENTYIVMRPQMTTTSEGLRYYDPKQRKCFYQSERRLRFFKTYTRPNCEEECLANLTNKICGCVSFAMPRDEDTKICGAAKIKCYKDVENRLFRRVRSKNEAEKTFRDKCNCLGACTAIKYVADVNEYELDPDIMEKSFGDSLPITRSSIVHIYYKDRHVSGVRRLASYTYTDFLAMSGDLLGLFLGISLLSVIELIYYFTLRLFWIVHRSRAENVVVPFKLRTITPALLHISTTEN